MFWFIFLTDHTGKGHESKPFYLEYYIKILYNSQNPEVDVQKFETCNVEGEKIIWTLIEYIYVDMIVVI